jgi:hypothetical protein
MIKARAHKGGMKIGKTPKNLDSICCPQCRETNADTLKQQRHRRREPGTREKVSLRRINLECNTYVQESNASQLPAITLHITTPCGSLELPTISNSVEN